MAQRRKAQPAPAEDDPTLDGVLGDPAADEPDASSLGGPPPEVDEALALGVELDHARNRIEELEAREAELVAVIEAGAHTGTGEPLVALDVAAGIALLTTQAQSGLGSPGIALGRAASLALTDAGLDEADLVIVAVEPGHGQRVRDLITLGPTEEAAA